MKNKINRGVFGLIGSVGWFGGIMVFMSANSTFHEQTAVLAMILGTLGGGIYQVLKRLDDSSRI